MNAPPKYGMNDLIFLTRKLSEYNGDPGNCPCDGCEIIRQFNDIIKWWDTTVAKRNDFH